MTSLLLVATAMLLPSQEPVSPHPKEKWYPLLEGCEFKEDRDKLIAAAPLALNDFEEIINDPKSSSMHFSGLYSVITDAKVDRKRFLKPALRDLNHADATVRRVAAAFVGNVGGGPEFTAPLLMLTLHDSDADVTNAARRALGQVGDASTVVALEHLIRFDSGKPNKLDRAKAFGDTRDEIKARLAAAAKAAPAPPK